MGRGWKGWASAGVLGALLWAWTPARGHAEPREIVTNGPDAALTDGTVVATAESSSAIWYNPAGLVSIKAGSVDLSGSVYAMQVAPVQNMLTLESGEQGDGRTLSFRVVPRAVSFATLLTPDLVFAAGVFHSALGENLLRVEADTKDGASGWAISDASYGYSLHIALSLGWQFRKNLSFGWALDGVYANSRSVSVVGSHTSTASGESYQMAEHPDVYSWGPQVRAGLRYEPKPGYRVGVMLGSPSLGIYQGNDTLKTHSGPGTGLELTRAPVGVIQSSGGTFDQLEPGRVRVGLARMWDIGWLALDGDLRFPMTSDLWADTSWGGTIRLGGIRTVQPRVRIGGGLFTVLERSPPLTTLGRANYDYYGINLGVDVSNRTFSLIAKGAFSIACAINYAYGRGQRAGMLAPDDPTSGAPQLVTRRAQIHDLSFNLALRASR